MSQQLLSVYLGGHSNLIWDASPCAVVGSGDRSRQFRLRSQRNLKDGGGGPDHVAMLRQMAAVHPSMDLDRVGIWGHSAVR